jgi:hypothetical protein
VSIAALNTVLDSNPSCSAERPLTTKHNAWIFGDTAS